MNKDVAMTGEITLRGRVLPIGGLKEKTLAAHRAGIRTIILPAKNRADLEELPPKIRRSMKFVPVESMEEVLATALVAKEKGVGARPAAATPRRPSRRRPPARRDRPLRARTPQERDRAPEGSSRRGDAGCRATCRRAGRVRSSRLAGCPRRRRPRPRRGP